MGADSDIKRIVLIHVHPLVYHLLAEVVQDQGGWVVQD